MPEFQADPVEIGLLEVFRQCARCGGEEEKDLTASMTAEAGCLSPVLSREARCGERQAAEATGGLGFSLQLPDALPRLPPRCERFEVVDYGPRVGLRHGCVELRVPLVPQPDPRVELAVCLRLHLVGLEVRGKGRKALSHRAQAVPIRPVTLHAEIAVCLPAVFKRCLGRGTGLRSVFGSVVRRTWNPPWTGMVLSSIGGISFL